MVSKQQHSNSCARRIARYVKAAGGSHYEAALSVHRHCGISLLRAHRVAHGFTQIEAVELMKDTLRSHGMPGGGLSQQRLSQWEIGNDMPTPHYLDALCLLYSTRPDRLGFGHDYTDTKPALETGYRTALHQCTSQHSATSNTIFATGLPAVAGHPTGVPATGKAAVAYVTLLEELTEATGYTLCATPSMEFIPSRMIDLARIQAGLLSIRSTDLKRRLYRVLAWNATYIAFRLTDIAALEDTFDWLSMARHAARRANDASMEGWVAGHTGHACAYYGRSLKAGLTAARVAQTAGGRKPSASSAFGYMTEAGVQAYMGRHREALDAIHHADRMFNALSNTRTVSGGLHLTEYHLRLHQSHALTTIGAQPEAEARRNRALKLEDDCSEAVGNALLHLDEAALHISACDVEEGCRIITTTWNNLSPEYRIGLVPRRVTKILDTVKPAYAKHREIGALRDLLDATAF
jgi:transcriptional regulator with XRE-family HTH domain